MADLANAVAAGTSQPITGYILSPPRLIEYGEAEREYEAEYMTRTRTEAAPLPPEQRKQMLQEAIDRITDGEFALGSTRFDRCCQRSEKLAFLTYLSLKFKHPQVTRQQAADFITPDNEAVITDAVYALWGYVASSKKKTTVQLAQESTGGESSDISARNAA